MGSHAERFLRGVGICSTMEGPRLAALAVAAKASPTTLKNSIFQIGRDIDIGSLMELPRA